MPHFENKLVKVMNNELLALTAEDKSPLSALKISHGETDYVCSSRELNLVRRSLKKRKINYQSEDRYIDLQFLLLNSRKRQFSLDATEALWIFPIIRTASNTVRSEDIWLCLVISIEHNTSKLKSIQLS